VASFERAMVVSYRLSIVTVALYCNHLAAICDRMSPTLKSTGWSLWATLGDHFGPNTLSGCSHWSRPPMLGSAGSEHHTLTNGEIISEEFQPV